MTSRKSEYKPLLFTTTVRNPKRLKGFLHIFSKYNGKILTNKLATDIAGELIKYGLYRPLKSTKKIVNKWGSAKLNPSSEIGTIALTNLETKYILNQNPQNHKEAGFDNGWPSRFATLFDFAKELGFVYYQINEKIKFSEIGLKLANSVKITLDKENNILFSNENPEVEQDAFLHALAKSQRNNPFVKVLNENVPLILLLEVINKLNKDKTFNGAGISKLELPLLIFWKNNNSEELYQTIKKIRKKYKYVPSWEVITDICVKKIMQGKFKKFKPKSIMQEYPDEFIRKMRLTGLISLRGGGRFLDINKKEIKKVNYVLKKYSKYQKHQSEKEYFNYMAKTDSNLIASTVKKTSIKETNKYLEKWVKEFSWNKLKSELLILHTKKLSKDSLLKYLSSPVRLEFLIAIAIKSKFNNIQVLPNYICDDEGLPTSTAPGTGNKGDIECIEEEKGILIEVTMSEGRSQTQMEIWPIARHLKEFKKSLEKSMCYFIAPTIYYDSKMELEYASHKEKLCITAKTISEFISCLESQDKLYLPELA